MFRILCISPHFPPRADAEAFCGAKLALELMKQGTDITVLCLDPSSPHPKPCDDSKLWDPLKKITVNIRTPGSKARLYSARLGLRYRAKNYARWIKAVIDTAESLHREKAYDAVCSRSLPMEAHIAGFWASRRLRLPWIANINDPWDWHLMPEGMRIECSFLQSAVSSFWMRKTLLSASLVTYPSARLRDYHIGISGVKHEGGVIPHAGYARERKENGNSTFCLVHAGKLGGLEARSPLALLRGIQGFLERHPEARRHFRMLFVGRDDDLVRSKSEELGLQSIVEHTGRVSYERSLEFIAGATVCVLVELNLSEGIFLPSKLADYLVAGKPVLALSPRNGVVADLSKKPGLVRVDIDREDAVETAITAYYEAFQSGGLDRMRPSGELAGIFEPNAVTRLFHHHLEDILKRSDSPYRTQ